MEYDHYCLFLSKTIGKGNRKVFVCGLVINYLATITFLYLNWVKINYSIEFFEHISTYCVNVFIKYWELEGISKFMILLAVIVSWYN